MEVFFINFNVVDMLNQYLTNIFILRNNLYNLHFNIKGEGASGFHKDLNNDINNINMFYDNLSEIIKKMGGYPITNLEEIIKISTIKEIVSKDYNVNEASNIMLSNYSIINNMNQQVGEYALKKYNLEILNFSLNFNKFLANTIWLLKMNNK